MKIYIILSAMFIVIMVGCISFYLANKSSAQESKVVNFPAMVDEVKALGEKYPSSRFFVTSVVQKYIPTHVDKATLLQECEEYGFYVSPSTKHQDVYIAKMFFGDFFLIDPREFTIRMTFSDGKLNKLTAKIWVKTLGGREVHQYE